MFRSPEIIPKESHTDNIRQPPKTSLAANVRLSAQLLQTTWHQTELNFEADLEKLKSWASKFQLFSGQQVGCWEIQTTWLPNFLAQNHMLIKRIFKG